MQANICLEKNFSSNENLQKCFCTGAERIKEINFLQGKKNDNDLYVWVGKVIVLSSTRQLKSFKC